MVVTSLSHLPRTLDIYRHIMGNEFEVQGISAPEAVTTKERVYEHTGLLMMREVLWGTKAGDHDAIKERLFDLVPGYAKAIMVHLATQSLTGLFKKDLT